MIEDVWVAGDAEDGFAELYASGDAAEGSFRCSECSYGVAIATVLPTCPMCSGGVWERAAVRGSVPA